MNEKTKEINDLKESETDIEPLLADGPHLWVKVKSKEAYEREGKLMGHCVANYYQRSSETTIYSLRDEENRPHCTIEMTGKEIRQIKGRANGEVVPRYHSTLRTFILHMNIPVRTYDAWKYGWIVVNGKLLGENELPEVLDLSKEHHRLGLSGFAKIPRVLKANNVTIRDQKNLNMAEWEITESLTLENCANVILPQASSPGTLILSDVKFAPSEKQALKEEEMVLRSLKLTRTDFTIKGLKVGVLAGVDSCRLEAGTLELTDHQQINFQTPGKIVTDHLKLTHYYPGENFSVDFNKLTVSNIHIHNNMLSKLDNIFLHPDSKVELWTTEKFTWPAHWNSVYNLLIEKST